MIIVRIYGGLGNQMFQYAAGRALALRHGVQLKLDLRWMTRYRNQPLLVTQFPIQMAEPDWVERLSYTWFPFQRHPPFPFFRWLPLIWRRVYMESGLNFDEKFLRLGPNHFLFGYFQSYRYFSDFAGWIRSDFHRPLDCSLYEERLLSRVRHPDSVAIQFRRGDYVTNPATNKSIGVCPMDYYRRAVDLIRDRTRNPLFVIFSDDLEWCRENVNLVGALFVERRGGTPLDDMVLAAECRHIILANSTFSWWCAWLRTSEDGMVVAPSKWFRDDRLNNQTSSLCPPSWTRL